MEGWKKKLVFTEINVKIYPYTTYTRLFRVIHPILNACMFYVFEYTYITVIKTLDAEREINNDTRSIALL